MCYQFLCKESTLFTTKTRFSIFSNEFSQHYWQESFGGDSFVSQSRFDAYAIGRNPSMVIPLLANQDLTPMHSQSRFDAYAYPNDDQGSSNSKKMHIKRQFLSF